MFFYQSFTGKIITRALKTPWYLIKYCVRRMFRHFTKTTANQMYKMEMEDRRRKKIYTQARMPILPCVQYRSKIHGIINSICLNRNVCLDYNLFRNILHLGK